MTPRSRSPDSSSVSTNSSRSAGSSRVGSSSENHRSTSCSASPSQRVSRSPSASSANSSPSSGFVSSSRSHWPGIIALARGAVRSAAGASKSRSSTAWTSVPRVAASLGFSGSLSITRNRYSRGHCMKSLARDGDSDDVGCWLVLMTQTLRPATDSERNTIDLRPSRTA